MRVNRDTCTCDCWDGLFKGGYDRGGMFFTKCELIGTGYKFIYFNLEWTTLVIFLIVLIYSTLAQRALFRGLSLLYERKLSFLAAAVLITCVYPNFYAFWMFFNYLNDQFYRMWYSQLAFSVTEMVVAVCYYRMLERGKEHNQNALWSCVVISSWHIMESLIDQGFSNLFLGAGRSHQVWRDLFFLLGDISVLIVSLFYLKRLYLPGVSGLPFDSRKTSHARFAKHAAIAAASVVGCLIGFRIYLALFRETVL